MTLATTGLDWKAIADSWEKVPCTIRGGAPVTLSRAYDAIATASAPFRSGTRVRTLPDVRFSVQGGLLRAPGDLLPGRDEAGLHRYLDRLEKRLSGEGYLLAVEAPQVLDFTLWSGVHDATSGLWRYLGTPVLPVSSTLLVGDGFTRHEDLTEPGTHATLTWVLQGSMRVRLWDQELGAVPAAVLDATEPPAGTVELEATAGELVSWPSRFRYADTYHDRCVVLRLQVPTDPAQVAIAVRDLLVDVLGKELERYDAVPYLPVPAAQDGVIGTVPPLRETAAAIRAALADSNLNRILRITWASRRSAGSIEPVPPARDASVLKHRDRILRCAEIIRIPDGPGRSVWAVNGHVFQVGGGAGDRILEQLRPDREIGVDELCRELGVGAGDDGVLALLRKLYALRGIRRAGEECRG